VPAMAQRRATKPGNMLTSESNGGTKHRYCGVTRYPQSTSISHFPMLTAM
jgi:hypothetical protein